MDFGVIRSAKRCAHKNQMKFIKLTEHNTVLLPSSSGGQFALGRERAKVTRL